MTKNRCHDIVPRFLFSILAISSVVVLLYFANSPILRYGVAAVISSIVATATWELLKMAEKKNRKPALCIGTILAGIYSYATFLSTQQQAWSALPFIVLYVALLLFFFRHFSKKEGAFIDIAINIFALIYVSVSLSCVFGILYFTTEGVWWCTYLLAVSKISDIAAYFIGKLWGKNKLAPMLSPGKTQEGAIAGFLCSITVSVFFSQYFLRDLSITEALLLGSAMSIASQLGDLGESLLKRDASVKDSNNLPGLGGILDAVDSLIFTSPLVFLYLEVFKS